MATTVDILIAFDSSSSMDWTREKIRHEFFDPLTQIHRSNSSNLRLGLIGFRSHVDRTTTYGFTSSSETFQQNLEQIRTSNESSNDPKGTALALEEGLTFAWRQEDDFSTHEKLFILFTDGPPCGLFNERNRCRCKDIWRLANEYLERNISMYVVGVEPEVNIVDDFYCGLAKKTGGEYFPLVNASRILLDVISSSLNEDEEKTFSQLLKRLDWRIDVELNSHYHFEEMKNRVGYILKYCRTMPEIRRGIYSYFRREIQKVSPTVLPLSPSINSNRSTPIRIPNVFNDDEGYRSALPTVASNSSLLSIYETEVDENSPYGDELESSGVFF